MSAPIRALWKQVTGVVSWPEKQILALLNQGGLDALPHSRNRSLSNHLTATRRILQAWNQPPDIQLAGLCHSIYSTDEYEHQAVALAQRAHVQDIIGARAERLAFLFSVVLRRPLFESLKNANSLKRGDRVRIEIRPDVACEEQSISGEEAAQLLILHLANLAEQSSERGGRPGTWLSRFTRLAASLRKADLASPPVFADCTVDVSQVEEMELRDAYSNALMNWRIAPDLAWAQLARCVNLCPYVAEPFIWKAFLAMQRHDPQVRIASSRQALDIMQNWRTAWDKRLEFAVWSEIVRELSAGKLGAAMEKHLLRLGELERNSGLVITRDEVGSKDAVNDNQGMRRFWRYLSRIALEKSAASIKVYPGLGRRELYNARNFSVVPALEASFDAIAHEVEELGDDGFHQETERIKRTGDWKVFMLYETGRKNERNCARCPTITRIVEEHDCVRRSGGLIYLSRLAPHTEVAPHRGPTNMRLRCHLAITVPEGDCGMRVGSQFTKWNRSECIVFDDHYVHEVWNRTGEERVVLLIDLWHPELTPEERNALDAMQWYACQQGLGFYRYWRKNEQQLAQEGSDATMVDERSSLFEASGLLDVEDH